MKPDNGRDSGNHSNNYDPGVKVGNEVSCFSDALPQPGQIQALKRPDPRKYGAGLARGAPPGPRVRRNSEPAKPLDGGMSVADKGDPASRPQVSDRRDSRSGGQQERPTPGVTPARTLRPGHRTHRKVGTAMKPGNGSSCGNSTGSGTTGTVTMADGITHTVRGAGEMHTLAEHDSKSQL